jgi:hypothetical protein
MQFVIQTLKHNNKKQRKLEFKIGLLLRLELICLQTPRETYPGPE